MKNNSSLKNFILVAGGLLLISNSVFALPLPASKSKWLRCGRYTINLDESKERFSISSGSVVKQGKAVFYPHQINFDDFYGETSSGLNKLSFSISRKDLTYQINNYYRNYSFGNDTGWVQVGKAQEGICEIIKNPTENNKI